MAKVEVDETEYAASQQVVRIFSEMLANPDARKKVLEAKKTVRPNEAIPEIDAAKPGFEAIDRLSKDFSDFRAELAKEKADREAAEKTAKFQSEWNASKEALKADGWLDDGIANIEKLAQERGIPDLEAAALLYRKLHPEPSPVEPSGYGRFAMFEMPSDADPQSYMKKLVETRGDSEAVLDAEIRAAINEVRGAPVRR